MSKDAKVGDFLNALKREFFPNFMDHVDFQKEAKLIYVSEKKMFYPAANCFYLIDQGVLRWENEYCFNALIGEGDFFGLPSHENKKYKALIDTVLWQLPRMFIKKVPQKGKRHLYRDTHRYKRWQSWAESKKSEIQMSVFAIAKKMQQTADMEEYI